MTGTGRYGWMGFEEDDSTDEIPDKYILTIVDPDGDEMAVIVHRTVDGKFPLDGDVANRKRTDADRIVAALNASRDEPEEDRVERAQRVLDLYRRLAGWDKGDTTQSLLGDLLADLRHFAHATRHEDDAADRLDFDSAVAISEMHFEDEKNED